MLTEGDTEVPHAWRAHIIVTKPDSKEVILLLVTEIEAAQIKC